MDKTQTLFMKLNRNRRVTIPQVICNTVNIEPNDFMQCRLFENNKKEVLGVPFVVSLGKQNKITIPKMIKDLGNLVFNKEYRLEFRRA